MNAITNSVDTRINAPFWAISAVLQASWKTCLGIISTPFAIVMPSNRYCREAADLTKFSKSPLQFLFKGALTVVNPNMEVENHSKLPGIFTYSVEKTSIHMQYEIVYSKDNTIFKGVKVRAVIFGSVLAKIVTRIMDLALGVIGAAAAFVTFGTVPAINTFAVRNLSVLGLIDDVCRGLRELARPSVLQHERTF